MKKYAIIKISLDADEIKSIDSYIQSGHYKNREEFILEAINDNVKKLEH